MFYPRTCDQILEDAFQKALKRCNKLGEKNKKYKRKSENRKKVKK